MKFLRKICSTIYPSSQVDQLERLDIEKWPRVITLCGSTRFKDLFIEANKELTLRGHVVLTVGCFMHADEDARIASLKLSLDDLHKHKIRMSDEVLIITDETGYIGDSTRSEIEYANSIDIPVSHYR